MLSTLTIFKNTKNERYNLFFVVIINFHTYPTVVIVTRAHQRPNGIELKSLSGFAYNEKVIASYQYKNYMSKSLEYHILAFAILFDIKYSKIKLYITVPYSTVAIYKIYTVQ